jgi:hypothetical protein
MEESKSQSTKLSDWLAYYQILIEDVRYAKSQQWRLCYYILLLLGAVFGLSRVFGQKSEIIIVLFIISVILAIAGTHFLLKFQRDLKRYRENIKNVRDKFPEDCEIQACRGGPHVLHRFSLPFNCSHLGRSNICCLGYRILGFVILLRTN